MLLVELAVGSLAVVTVFDARRMVTRGYVQLAALVVGPTALLAVLLARGLGTPDEVDGYALGSEWFGPLRATLYLFLAVCIAYGLAAFAGHRMASLLLGDLGASVGAAALLMVAGLVAPPAWSFAGVLLSMLAAALALGGTLMAMSWGHWYLTNSGLPKEPLEQMSLLVAAALALQAVLLVVGVAFPAREVPLTDIGIGVGLAANPAFWLRVLVGLVFPLGLALLAYKAASIRGMMSATGLLYIATGAVLAGEVLARGLLFATGTTV
jgi:hypothetical protein